MDRRLELELLGRLLDLDAERSTSSAARPRRQDTSVYVDHDRLRAELDVLLRGRPAVAGLTCDLAQPGSYFTAIVGTVPVLVVRPPDGGGPRCFLNACRHRGSTAAAGRGDSANAFTCPYHGWSYGYDGGLIGRPLARGAFGGLDGDSGLIELPCREDCGVVVVATSPSQEPFDVRDLLAGLGDELDAFDFGAYRFVGERNTTWQFNWKLAYETFLESYHVFSLHRQTLAKQLRSAPMLADFFGPHGRGVVMGNECRELAALPTSAWSRFGNATFVYWLFPNTVLSLPQSGHAELWHFLPVDGQPGRSSVAVRFYAPPAAPQDGEFWDRLISFTTGVVDAEDFGQQELIQRNVSTGLVPTTVFGRNEPGLIHFHEQLDAALGTDTRR